MNKNILKYTLLTFAFETTNCTTSIQKPTKVKTEFKERLTEVKKQALEQKDAFLHRNSKEAREKNIEYLSNENLLFDARLEVLQNEDVKAHLEELNLNLADAEYLCWEYLKALQGTTNLEIKTKEELVNYALSDKVKSNFICAITSKVKEVEEMAWADNGSIKSRIEFNRLDAIHKENAGRGTKFNRIKHKAKGMLITVDKGFSWLLSWVTHSRFSLIGLFTDLLKTAIGLGIFATFTFFAVQIAKKIIKELTKILTSSENMINLLKLAGVPLIFAGAIAGLMHYFGFGLASILYCVFFSFLSTWELELWFLRENHNDYYLANLVVIDDVISPILAILSIPLSLYFGLHISRRGLGLEYLESYIIGFIFELVNYYTLLNPLFRVLEKEKNKEIILGLNSRFFKPSKWFTGDEVTFIQNHGVKLIVGVLVVLLVLANAFHDPTYSEKGGLFSFSGDNDTSPLLNSSNSVELQTSQKKNT